jgi:hypothetical protein
MLPNSKKSASIAFQIALTLAVLAEIAEAFNIPTRSPVFPPSAIPTIHLPNQPTAGTQTNASKAEQGAILAGVFAAIAVAAIAAYLARLELWAGYNMVRHCKFGASVHNMYFQQGDKYYLATMNATDYQVGKLTHRRIPNPCKSVEVDVSNLPVDTTLVATLLNNIPKGTTIYTLTGTIQQAMTNSVGYTPPVVRSAVSAMTGGAGAYAAAGAKSPMHGSADLEAQQKSGALSDVDLNADGKTEEKPGHVSPGMGMPGAGDGSKYRLIHEIIFKK